MAEAPRWDEARARFASPLFDAVRAPLDVLGARAQWPGLGDLNALAAGLGNARGKPLRFVAAEASRSAREYESRIAWRGEIATRERNWHDFFNALCWLAFPAAKGTISQMHEQLLAERGECEARQRSKERDVLTLFDEGGMVIASADERLSGLLRGFRWRELFVACRAEVIASMRFFLFGHALLEKALAPHLGVTARAVVLPADEAFLRAPGAEQVGALDRHLARWLAERDNLASTRRLHPVPFLGIPGWCAANRDPAFYDNTGYFRSGRGFGRPAPPARG